MMPFKDQKHLKACQAAIAEMLTTEGVDLTDFTCTMAYDWEGLKIELVFSVAADTRLESAPVLGLPIGPH